VHATLQHLVTIQTCKSAVSFGGKAGGLQATGQQKALHAASSKGLKMNDYIRMLTAALAQSSRMHMHAHPLPNSYVPLGSCNRTFFQGS
jgi:hypothetical protein